MGRHVKRRRTGALPVILLLIAAIIVGAVLLRHKAPAQTPDGGKPAGTEATAPAQTPKPKKTPAKVTPTPEPTPEPTPPPTPEPTPTPWYLVLVNRDNPVPEDWTVEPVEMPNGQIVDARIYEPLMEMFEAAKGINMDVLPNVESGYRSAESQQAIYERRVAEYKEQGWSESGARAETEKWVALPGTSEHQLGIAVDISGAVYAIYPWLAENAWQYGFILRYPPEKTAITGISGEEWHYRYVGPEAAAEIHERGITLEEYLAEKGS